MHRYALLALFACDGKDPGSPPGDDDDDTSTTTPEPQPTTPTTPGPASCLPALVEVGGPFVEGDTVEVEIVCTSGASGAEYVPRLLVSPDDTVLDPATWRVTFATDLASAGPYELFVSVDVEGGVAESVQETIWVADAGPGVTGNTPPDPAVYT